MAQIVRDAWCLALSGGAFARPIWLFWIDFIVYPVLAAAIIATSCNSWSWLAMAFGGAILFTFVEYWMHRWPLHKMLYHGSHERHHTHPAEFVVFPIYYTPAIFGAVYLVLPLSCFAGFVIGYCWFLIWHHVLHHIDLNNWPRQIQRYALWHLAHHHNEECNFGITVPLWDWLFLTYRRA